MNESTLIAVDQPVTKHCPATPRGTLLTLEGKAKIGALFYDEMTQAKIAVRIKRTVDVLKRYLSDPSEYGKRFLLDETKN